jgi:hypothetical protein
MYIKKMGCGSSCLSDAGALCTLSAGSKAKKASGVDKGAGAGADREEGETNTWEETVTSAQKWAETRGNTIKNAGNVVLGHAVRSHDKDYSRSKLRGTGGNPVIQGNIRTIMDELKDSGICMSCQVINLHVTEDCVEAKLATRGIYHRDWCMRR